MMARLVVCAAVLISWGASACADTLKAFVGTAVKPFVAAQVDAFEKSTGHKVDIGYGLATALRKQIEDGVSVDLVVFPKAEIDALIAKGLVKSDSVVTLLKSGNAVVQHENAKPADVSNRDSFVSTLRAARSLVYSKEGPSGLLMARIVQQLGLSEELKSRTTLTPAGVSIAEVVARGEAEMGFQQLSEVMAVKGVRVAGLLPAQFGGETVYQTATPGKISGAAMALSAWLKKEATRERLAAVGFIQPE